MTPEEIQEEIASRISHDDMASFSGLSYGAAGACLAIILLLAQIWTVPPKLLHVWAVALAAVAMPAYIAVGVFDQIWHSFKLPYLALQRIPRVNLARAYMWYAANACLLASIDCVLFGLSPLAGCIFAALAPLMTVGVFMAFRYAGGRALVAALQEDKKIPPQQQ